MATFSAEPWRNPRADELTALFGIVTRELPVKMILAAEVHIREPKMASKELEELISRDVADAVADERKNAERAGGIVLESDLKELAESVAVGLKQRFSGERKLRGKEWYSRSGRLFRNDQFDYAHLDAYPELKENIMSENIPTLFTKIGLRDSDFQKDTRYPQSRSMSINHAIQSGTVHREGDFDVDEPEMWRALSMEAELAFPIGVLLVEADSIPEVTPFNDMMVGARMDPKKLDQAMKGEVMGWKISARDEMRNGRTLSRIEMVGQPGSLFGRILGAFVEKAGSREIRQELEHASLAEYSYLIGDVAAHPKLFQAEKRVPDRHETVSNREWEEETGLLKSWRSSERDLESNGTTTVTYTFTKMDLQADFSDDEIFGFGQLEKLEFVSYGNRIVKHPEGARIIESTGQGDANSRWIVKVLLFCFLLLPILFLRKRVGLT
ncbi:hypothetical protein N9B57_02920 [Verrucomicrobia bacterium]|nr:hypothetical protein [Verrucomicrobiota bacterium]